MRAPWIPLSHSNQGNSGNRAPPSGNWPPEHWGKSPPVVHAHWEASAVGIAHSASLVLGGRSFEDFGARGRLVRGELLARGEALSRLRFLPRVGNIAAPLQVIIAILS